LETSKDNPMKILPIALATALAVASSASFGQTTKSPGTGNSMSQTTGSDMSTKGGQANPERNHTGTTGQGTGSMQGGMNGPSSTGVGPGSQANPPSEGKK
jgi:hypothetical protein